MLPCHRGTTLLSRTYPGMVIFHWIILAFWLLFIAYWAISAIGAKRSVPTRTWWKQSVLSLVILSLIVIALRVPLLSHTIANRAGS